MNRIIFKPYRVKPGANMDTANSGCLWRCETDFPASMANKRLYGKGIDKMSALADLISWSRGDIHRQLAERRESEMYVMPDQIGFEYWVLELDGYKPERDEWLFMRQYWNAYKTLPSDSLMNEWRKNNM